MRESVSASKTVTAALLVIGDEILSGRTKDRNIGFVAESLADLGIELREVRIVADVHEAIIDAVTALSGHHDLVFTTGGIGPTHDDITAEAVAAAFGLDLQVNAEAVAVMEARYKDRGEHLNKARLRMARIPAGARLIANPVSAAPGFVVENVHVMAGVPAIMQAMFDEIVPSLPTGSRIHSETIEAGMGESAVATLLENVEAANAPVRIGSYPYHDGERFTTRIVLRSRDRDAIRSAAEEIRVGLAHLRVSE